MPQQPHEFEERRSVPHHYDLPKHDNGIEVLKHIGTALVAMLPLGTAYMNLKEDVLRSSIAINQLKEDLKTVETTVYGIDKHLSTLDSADRELRSNIDMTISSTSGTIRELKKKLAELEKGKK